MPLVLALLGGLIPTAVLGLKVLSDEAEDTAESTAPQLVTVALAILALWFLYNQMSKGR